jgi:putative transposase
MPHRERSTHDKNHPVHVTLRAAKPVPSLRKQSIYIAVRRALAETWREWFRVIHFSVQSDHVHLLIEADDEVALSRGMAGLSIRLARAINRAAGRKGKVFDERYHARELSTPRETRNAIVYVLLNRRKHAAKAAWATGSTAWTAGSIGAPVSALASGIDPMSSGYWFDGWKPPSEAHSPPWWDANDLVPVRPARTWLARKGWRRHGLVGVDERPKSE